ncbi:MAG TPA: iron-sulfur cluster assembly protein [Thermoanaerobaculia bacterium]|nr:iron-sulfur cluster assembly protein [Thermoanaerobaculia bacterium]
MNDQLSREQKAELVRDALRQVVDPEIGLSVTELGLLREVQIEDDHTHLVMILTTPFCPYAPQLLEASRQKAQETLGVPTTIEVGMELWDPSMAEEGVLSDWGLF